MGRKVVISAIQTGNCPVPHEDMLLIAESFERHPPKTRGNRYVWKDGWQFDIGRKPYLVEAPDGTITRLWGRSKEDLIIGCKLSKAHKIVDDPFRRK